MVSLVQPRRLAAGALATCLLTAALPAQEPWAPIRPGLVVGAAGEFWVGNRAAEPVAGAKLGWYRAGAPGVELGLGGLLWFAGLILVTLDLARRFYEDFGLWSVGVGVTTRPRGLGGKR